MKGEGGERGGADGRVIGRVCRYSRENLLFVNREFSFFMYIFSFYQNVESFKGWDEVLKNK